jgi:hypothetical protein
MYCMKKAILSKKMAYGNMMMENFSAHQFKEMRSVLVEVGKSLKGVVIKHYMLM